MANPKPHTTQQTATERLEASRSVKDDCLVRELALAAIVARMGIWPAWRSFPTKPQKLFPELLNLETPAGRIVYRLTAEEVEMFGFLERRPNDGASCTAGDKMARLLILVQRQDFQHLYLRRQDMGLMYLRKPSLLFSAGGWHKK